MFVAIFFTLAAATLEDATTLMDEVYVSSFLSPEDITRSLDVKEALQNSEISNQGVDLISQLSELLYLPREDAIHHFIDRNRPELKIAMVEVGKLIKAPNDVVLAGMLSSCVLPSQSLIPLVSLVAGYITGKRTMCLYDYLPEALREPVQYGKIFSSGSTLPELQSIVAGSNVGIASTLNGDSSLHKTSTFVRIDENLIARRTNAGFDFDPMRTFHAPGASAIRDIVHIRVYDLAAKCAVYVNPMFTKIQFFPKFRAVALAERDMVASQLWRGGASDRIRIGPVPSFHTFGLNRDQTLFILEIKALTREYRSREGSLTTIPTSNDAPFVATKNVPLNSLDIYYPDTTILETLRDSTGALHVLSDKGKRLMLSFFRGEVGEIRQRLEILETRVHERLTVNQRIIKAIARSNSSFKAELGYDQKQFAYVTLHVDTIPGMGDIVTFPFDQWLEEYTRLLDRIMAEDEEM